MAERFDLNKGLCVQEDSNSITFLEEGGNLYLSIKVRIQKSQLHPLEDSPIAWEKAIAREKVTQNCRSTKDPGVNHLRKGTCEVEIRKLDLENNKADSILTLHAEIDPKLPYSGFSFLTEMKTLVK